MTVFKTDIYSELKEKDLNLRNNIIIFGSWGFAFFVSYLCSIEVIKSNILWVVVLFIALIIHFFNRISNFGKRVEYTYTEKISLEITKENITIEDKKYNWKNVNNIKIEYSDFDGKQIFRSFYDLNPSVSSGINNFISFTTTENESISYKFQLHSSEQIDVLREVFREMAKEKTVRLETIKLLYQPINYADHQKIKSIYENINN